MKKHKVDFESRETVRRDIYRHIMREYPETCKQRRFMLGIQIIEECLEASQFTKHDVLFALGFNDEDLLQQAVKMEEDPLNGLQ
jgi:hypothetical protein